MTPPTILLQTYRTCVLAVLTLGLALQAASTHAADCTVQLSQSELDYGRITRGELAAPTHMQTDLPLHERHVTLTAICASPSAMALFFRATAVDASRFRLADGGSFSINIDHALLDGKPVSLGSVRYLGEPPSQIANSLPLRPHFGVQPLIDGQAAQGTQLSVQLTVKPQITAATSLRRDETDLHQQGTFDMVTP
ncbi:hypothetical protein EO087_06340 [Dyella sp. M7H15-1]|uniref:hypothetical protein n=1 Tax=Dyella sp. M7H15-1 TaxID=2501295 RepID=UPI001005011A|nr:hypothetical protein [Dyella sp. M7H15-1]QAU23649.1 hypothetical protein EO087_06340 [Dyella sp. M7H15-1]